MKRFSFALLILLAFTHQSYANRVVLDNLPHYQWWYGCTPTAAGSLIAYWDSQPGFENLYKKGDAQIYDGDGTWGTRRMVASQSHIDGYDDPPDSLAGFLGTSLAGATSTSYITYGLKNFAQWDDTTEYDMKDSYQAVVDWHRLLWDDISFDFVKSEIDAGRPILLNMNTMTDDKRYAHSVICYGYDDDITFEVYDEFNLETMTLPGFAVMDTWTQGSGSQSRWYNQDETTGDYIRVEEIFDYQAEWWPYYPMNLPGGTIFSGNWDWRVNGLYTFQLIIPEPATLFLLSLGTLFLGKYKNKSPRIA